MEQTPIEKAIAELEEKVDTSAGIEQITAYQKAVEIIKSFLPHEKTYHRNIAEKAWDACQKWNDFIDDDGTLGEIIHNKMPFDREDFIKKQLKL